MEYKEAWQIAGMIVDMLNGLDYRIPMRTQEKIAEIILEHGNMEWSEFKQE